MSNLHAYYFSFETTGDPTIDAILEAVAAAGKGAHHTSEWDEYLLIAPIQEAANNAAAALAKARGETQ